VNRTIPSREGGVSASALTKRFRESATLTSRFSSSPLRETLAVDRVDLRLNEGEIFGLVGPNGAGKTTLIKMLTTLLTPTSGEARIAGHDIVREEKHVRRLVGLVTCNERSFYWRLSGRENLRFFADLYQVGSKAGLRWIDDLLSLVGLAHKADERFDGYSTGMRQRLALARGLLSRPLFLFMDEPTKGVDPLGAAEIIEMIRGRVVELWKPTILITSHNLTEIERLCERIALMHRGRIIASGSLEELRRLVRPAEVYRMRISRLGDATLHELVGTIGSLEFREPDRANGALAVNVTFPPNTEGLARFLRAVINAGGDVHGCSAVEQTLDDIFQKLVERQSKSDAVGATDA